MGSTIVIYNDCEVSVKVWWELYGGGAPAGGYRETTLAPDGEEEHDFTLSLPIKCMANYKKRG